MVLLAIVLIAATSPEVSVVYNEGASEVSPLAARHVRDRLESPPEIRTSTTIDLPLLLQEALARHARFVVVLAPERGQITVIRTQDGTALSRFIDRGTTAGSAYAVAVTAVELLELARRPPGSPDAPVMEPVIPGGWSWLLGAGASLASGLVDQDLLFAPAVESGMVYRGDGGGWWAAFELRSSLGGSARSTLQKDAERTTTDYRRYTVDLAASIGLTRGSFDLGLLGSGGLAVVVADVIRDPGIQLAADTRLAGIFSVGGVIRLRIGGGFGIGVVGEVGFCPQPARYRVRDNAVLEEDVLRAQGAVLASWESP